ncbi:hypothetical protein ScPMuIL_009795 [Solemya velum]
MGFLTKIAICIVVTGVALHVIGFATPHWQELNNLRIGLWEICYDTEGCRSVFNDSHIFVNRAAQTMECLALICGVVCVVVSIMMSLQVEMTKGRCFKIVSVGTAFLAGICGLIGAIIFGMEDNLKDNKNTLSWSFATVIVGAILNIVGGCLLIP